MPSTDLYPHGRSRVSADAVPSDRDRVALMSSQTAAAKSALISGHVTLATKIIGDLWDLESRSAM